MLFLELLPLSIRIAKLACGTLFSETGRQSAVDVVAGVIVAVQL